MVDPLFPGGDDAATPLEAEELEQLIPSYITTRAELNEVEQVSISDADRWAFSRKRDILDIEFFCKLHERMFKGVWKWAGQFRTSARNIGVEVYNIRPCLTDLIEDVRIWIQNETFEADEIAVRFHHRLVQIHPFPNGNGRHARMAADLLAVSLGQRRFSWGRDDLVQPADARRQYIDALGSADQHDIEPLLEFARS